MRHLLACAILLPSLCAQLAAQSPDPAAAAPDPTATAPATSGSQAPAAETNQVTPAGSALSTIFSPMRAPKRKTMGLLQRSFLDLADQGDQALEVAVVVDGTDSMSTELAGVRQSIHQMLDDLRQYRNNEVRAAIVVYRDAGSPSGEVVIPLKRFTADKEEIAKAVEALKPESGAPFFHELPDLGLYKALTELPWSDDDQVTKWILMFGDAPPYAETFKDPKNKAYRRYATPLLIAEARGRNIRINCVLCTSSGNVSKPYDEAIDQTRSFMNELAGATDGLMLDLSYPEIRTALLDASKQPEVGLAKIEPISAIDLASVRRENIQQAGEIKQVRLAVVPHVPLSQMTFDTDNQAVHVSTALRTQLSQVSGVRVASPRDIKDQLRRLRAEGITDDQTIRGLAARLGVDYVVWGSLAPQQATVQTAAYRRDNGQQIVPIKLAQNSDDLAYVLIEASAKSAPDDQALSQLFTRMQSMKTAITAPMADNVATNSELLTALESLDQALAYESGSAESVDLLAKADRASRNAITAEPRNALAHWLQANVAYNQASRLFRTADNEAAAARMQDMRSALRRAVENRDRIANPSLITEIEADYHLLVTREPQKAVEGYLAMTKSDQPIQSQLRGHWMLAGIYAGDWGTTEQPTVDPVQARRHVIEVMANWPDSPEASLLKQWLRWDDTKEQTEFNYLPQVNAGLTET